MFNLLLLTVGVLLLLVGFLGRARERKRARFTWIHPRARSFRETPAHPGGDVPEVWTVTCPRCPQQNAFGSQLSVATDLPGGHFELLWPCPSCGAVAARKTIAVRQDREEALT